MRLTIISCVLGLLASCTTAKNFTYFRDVSDTVSNLTISDTGYHELTIKPDDVLTIAISSPNPEANSFFSTPGVTANPNPAQGGNNSPNTYLVDKRGEIVLPLVGSVNLKGLTSNEARTIITSKVSTFLKSPIVNIRFSNFKITVLGEVSRPANYIVPNERVSVLDAIGMAGDLTIFGKRENVLLVREKDGKKVLTRLNLNSSSLFQSPYYYLQQNDILYIEPTKAKAANNDLAQIRTISIIASLATLATVIISRF